MSKKSFVIIILLKIRVRDLKLKKKVQWRHKSPFYKNPKSAIRNPKSSRIFAALTIVSMTIEQNRNEDWMKLLLSEIAQHYEKIKLGGGKKSIAKQREKNKLTARE